MSIDLSSLDRLPPHSIDTEKGVLGCILLSQHESMGLCLESGVTSDWFYDLRHKDLFQCFQDMTDERISLDEITASQRLKNLNQLDMVGGLPYLSELMDVVQSVANLTDYLGILREKKTLRAMIRTCSTVIARAQTHEGEVDALVDSVERDILQIGKDRDRAGSITPIKVSIRNAIDSIERSFKRNGAVGGLQTGITDLDKLTDGLHEGEMIVIAARPSVGKSSFAMNIAEHVSVVSGLACGVFSLEMTSDELSKRMLCSHARINSRSVQQGYMTEQDMRRMTSSAAKISCSPIHIDDTSGLSIGQLRARARRMWQQHGIKLFIVDYLQLVHASGRRALENRQQEVSEVSASLKEMAKELRVPVIVLAQLNRGIEKEKHRKPRLSDIRESGAVEQDADVIGFLYRAETNEDEDPSELDAIPVNLLIAKQRNGPSGEDVRMIFRCGITRFEPASKIQA